MQKTDLANFMRQDDRVFPESAAGQEVRARSNEHGRRHEVLRHLRRGLLDQSGFLWRVSQHKYAVKWGQVSEEELVAAILDQLSCIFGSWAREPAGFVLKNWNADPFVGGGPVAVPSIGSMFGYHAIRQSFGPIHFAGTETAIQ